MIVLATLAVIVATLLLSGRRPRHLGDIQVKAAWAAVTAVLAQIAIVNITTYGLAAWFVVANRRISGLWIIAVGAALNLAAIAANDGVMPASPAAVRTAGRESGLDKFVNSRSDPDARLAVLGDIFAIPQGWPLANVFSIGDIILVIGTAIVLDRATRANSRAGVGSLG
jgi:Family of unknown function (DUF5317)